MVESTKPKDLFDRLRKMCGGKLFQKQVDVANKLISEHGLDTMLELIGYDTQSASQECMIDLDVYPTIDGMPVVIETDLVMRLRLISGGKLTQKQVDILDLLVKKSYASQALGKGKGEDIQEQLKVFLGVDYSRYYLTEEKLRAMYPRADVAFVEHINKWAPVYGITTQERMSGYLANMIYESNGFTSLRENMNYSAKRFYEVFKRRVGTLANAYAIVKAGPVAIANAVYNGRYGNRVGSNDGYDYRGGGLTHTTFRNNYRDTGKGIGVDLEAHPELITDPSVAVQSSMWYFADRGCNEKMDVGDFRGVCIAINGGTNGLSSRIKLYKKIQVIL